MRPFQRSLEVALFRVFLLFLGRDRSPVPRRVGPGLMMGSPLAPLALSPRGSLMSRSSPRTPRTPSSKLSPLAMMRAETSRPSTTSAQVRGGGRLYTLSPIEGYSEAEMVREARLRIEHNKQRARLKHLLATASDGGPVVKTSELMLACEIAKLPLSPEKVASTPFAKVRVPQRKHSTLCPPRPRAASPQLPSPSP